MQIVGVQLDIAWEDPPANHAKVEAMLAGANLQPGAMVVLPEMFTTGFTMNLSPVTMCAVESQEFLCELAKRLQVTILAGLAMPPVYRLGRNRALAFSPEGKIIASYTKLHPFSLGGEHKSFEPGTELVTFPWQGFTVAPFVCYDLRFPEIFRHAARRGANLTLVIANWPIARAEHWLTLLRARAIENQAYVVGVNRVGRDPNTLYGGRSIVVDPMGVVRADAGAEESVLIVDIDLDFVQQTRERLPFLQDLRDDFIPPR
jgi:omega-amidase